MKTLVNKIGNQQVTMLIDLGELLAVHGNAGANAVNHQLGMTKKDTTRARTLYQFKAIVKDSNSVVNALQIIKQYLEILNAL